MITEEQQQQIDRFLNDDLQGAALTAFEAQLKTDNKLAEELFLQQDILKAQTDQDMIEVEKILADIGSGYKQKKGEIRPLYRRLLVAASLATIFALAGILGYLFYKPGLSDADLFSAYYETYPLRGVVRSNETNAITEANNAFQKKDFKAALDNFQKVINSDPRRMDIIFYAGICNLELNQNDQAIIAFQKVIDHGDNYFVEDARWYLSLTFLKTGEKSNAVPILEGLVESGESYKTKAASLLNELRE